MHQSLRSTLFSSLLALSAVNAAHAACGAAGCAINTNRETQGPHPGPGWRVDLRFEYVKQDTLRKGSNKMAHSEPETGEDGHEEEEEGAHAEAAAARRPPARVMPTEFARYNFTFGYRAITP